MSPRKIQIKLFIGNVKQGAEKKRQREDLAQVVKELSYVNDNLMGVAVKGGVCSKNGREKAPLCEGGAHYW